MQTSIAQTRVYLLLAFAFYIAVVDSAYSSKPAECILAQVHNPSRPELPRRVKSLLSLLEGHSTINLTAWAKDVVEARVEIEKMRPDQHLELRQEISRLYSNASSSSRNGIGTKRILDILISYEFQLRSRMEKAVQEARTLNQNQAQAVQKAYLAHLSEVQSALQSQQEPLRLAGALREILRDQSARDLFPEGTSFRIFGSQVNGTARANSDLDLFISSESLERSGLYALRDRLNKELTSRFGPTAPPVKDLLPIGRDEGATFLGLKPPIQIEVSGDKAKLILQGTALRVHRAHRPSYPLENNGPSVSYEIELP